MSNATAVDALPDIGRTSIRGRISDGILNKLSIGERILDNKSKIPEFLRALIAKNRPTSVGKIFITVLIPSLQPTKKLSKTFIFAKKPYAIM